jgi:hypothetical protein
MQAKKRGRDEFISDFKKLRGDQGLPNPDRVLDPFFPSNSQSQGVVASGPRRGRMKCTPRNQAISIGGGVMI